MSTRFEIKVAGSLPSEWISAFGQLEMMALEDGTTRIRGTFPDQAALYGLLLSLRDWGLELVAVTPLALEGEENDNKRS